MMQLVFKLVHVTNMPCYFLSQANWNHYIYPFLSHFKSRAKGLACFFSKPEGNGGLQCSEYVPGTFSMFMLHVVLASSFYRLENRNSEKKELVMFVKY